MRPPFLGARMTNGVTVLTPQIEVYLGAGRPAGRPGRFPHQVYAERYLNTNSIRRKIIYFSPSSTNLN